MINYEPRISIRYYSGKAMTFFVGVLVLVSLIFNNNIWPLYLWVLNIGAVALFFYGTEKYNREWERFSAKTFTKKLFWVGFSLRVVYAIANYYFNIEHFGEYWGTGSSDISFYVPTAEQAAKSLSNGHFDIIQQWSGWGIDYSDMGYMLYLAIIYWLTGNLSIVILPLIIKAVLGTYTCVLMYKIAQRHFGESVARLTALFCLFNPNMIYWCGSMMKETEMIFMVSFFVEQSEILMRDRSLTFARIAPVVFSGLFLFTFRTVLGIVAFLALMFALAISSSKVAGWGKRIIIGSIVLILVGVTYGNSIATQTKSIIEKVQGGEQQTSLEWRTRRSNGNQFAKYASATVFAPLIFTIPFPTLSYTYFGQEQLMQNAGGNYIKNLLSFFVIIVMFQFLFSGKWRDHLLPIAFVLGYLVVLAMSTFAQSGRFHMPVLPFEMMFAAYGISTFTKKQRHWYTYMLAGEMVICVAWQYFKLKGQGLI